MSSRLALTFGAAAAAMLLTRPAAGGTLANYSQEGFSAAQEAGKPIVLAFTALGCKVCEAQTKALERLLAQSPLDAITGFQVDFDMAAELARTLRASRSTLVVFQGKKELAREAGITTDGQIRTLLLKAVPEKRRGKPGPRPSNRTGPRP